MSQGQSSKSHFWHQLLAVFTTSTSYTKFVGYFFPSPTNSPNTHTPGCPTILSVLTLNTQSELNPSRLPSSSEASHKSWPPVLLTNWLCIGGSHDPLLRFTNLLKWLTELKKNSLLLLVYCRGRAKQKTHAGQGIERWCGASMLSLGAPPSAPVCCSPTHWAGVGVFMKIPLWRHDWINLGG